MSRLCLTILVIFFAQHVVCHVISADKGSPTLENESNVPVANEARLPQANVVDSKTCAQIGEYCVFHNDCCSRSCLGFMKRCVS